MEIHAEAIGETVFSFFISIPDFVLRGWHLGMLSLLHLEMFQQSNLSFLTIPLHLHIFNEYQLQNFKFLSLVHSLPRC